MAAEEAFPVSRWPYDPSWDLDGFDFSVIPVANYRNAVRKLHHNDFSPDLPPRKSRLPHQHSVVVANNVAVLFLAMKYCKDWWSSHSTNFWESVSRCSRVLGPSIAVMAAGLFVSARRAYLNTVGGGCPNGAARAVDAWIAFLDSPRGGRTRTAVSVPPPTHFNKWKKMKQRRELANRGQSLGQQMAANLSPAPLAPPRSPANNRMVFEAPPATPLIKREENPDEITIVAVSPVTPSERGLKRKRDHTESPGSAGPSSPKRPSNTSTRVAKCEDKLAEHLNLIHATDFKIEAQGELVSAHVTKLDELESRLQSVENRSTGRTKARKLEESVARLTERLDSRNTYIRAEVKKVWNDTRNIPTEQEQTHIDNRIDNRLDTIRGDLAVHKVRIEDCQRSVDEQINLIKQKSKHEKLRRGELTARILDLEERFEGSSGNSGSSSPPSRSTSSTGSNQDASDDAGSVPTTADPNTTITALLGRVIELEAALKKQDAEHAKLRASHAATLRRVADLEGELVALGKTVKIERVDVTTMFGEYHKYVDRRCREIVELRDDANAVPATQTVQASAMQAVPTQGAHAWSRQGQQSQTGQGQQGGGHYRGNYRPQH